MHRFSYLLPLVLLLFFIKMGVGTAKAETPGKEPHLAPGFEYGAPTDIVLAEEPPLNESELTNQELGCDRWTRGYWAFSCQLAHGDRNNQVRAIQLVLNCSGINAGAVTGIFDTQTQNAVRASQWFGGRPMTGIVDAPTWRDYESRLVLAGSIGSYLLYQVKGCEAYGSLFLKISGSSNGWWYVYHPASNTYVPMSRDCFTTG